jgi:hypothetical protein
MKQTYTSSKIVSATRFDGKPIDYICELTIQPLNQEQFQIVDFSTQEFELNKMCPETIHKLSNENIIYSPNEIQKLTHNNKNIRPIKIDKIDVYPIIYESKPGWVEEANIPCDLITDAIEKIPKQEIKKETRGRHKKYASDVERKEAQQKHALLHHYRKEALENYLKSNPNDDIITVLVQISSRVLGEINEEIKYRKLQDGSYRKIQE